MPNGKTKSMSYGAFNAKNMLEPFLLTLYIISSMCYGALMLKT